MGIFGGAAAGKRAPGRVPTEPPGAAGTSAGSVSGRVTPMLTGGAANGGQPANASSAGTSTPSTSEGVAAPIASGGGAVGAGGVVVTSGAGGTDSAAATETTAGAGMTPSTVPSDPSVPCSPGYLAVAGQCVCDLNGTFALHGKIPVALQDMEPLEGLNDTIDLWGIVRQEYDAQGNIEIRLTACGQTSPDTCIAAAAPVVPSPEAWAQYVPVELWEKPTTPAVLRISLPGALPGATFATPALAQLFGVTLTDPLGPWPATRKDLEGGGDFDGSSVNGARWIDMDGDGKLGMTIKLVGPGGATATPTSGPPRAYAATSSVCPRSDPRAARSPYAYVPLPQGLGVRRVKEFHAAQRSALELHGALESCDRISGMLTGPNGRAPTTDLLIGGCTTVNGSGESACTSAMLDSAASGGGGATLGLEFGTGSFLLVRVEASVTCAKVRAQNLN